MSFFDDDNNPSQRRLRYIVAKELGLDRDEETTAVTQGMLALYWNDYTRHALDCAEQAARCWVNHPDWGTSEKRAVGDEVEWSIALLMLALERTGRRFLSLTLPHFRELQQGQRGLEALNDASLLIGGPGYVEITPVVRTGGEPSEIKFVRMKPLQAPEKDWERNGQSRDGGQSMVHFKPSFRISFSPRWIQAKLSDLISTDWLRRFLLRVTLEHHFPNVEGVVVRGVPHEWRPVLSGAVRTEEPSRK